LVVRSGSETRKTKVRNYLSKIFNLNMSAWSFIPETGKYGWFDGPVNLKIFVTEKEKNFHSPSHVSFKDKDSVLIIRKKRSLHGDVVEIQIDSDFRVTFDLPYGHSFEKAIKDMKNHYGC